MDDWTRRRIEELDLEVERLKGTLTPAAKKPPSVAELMEEIESLRGEIDDLVQVRRRRGHRLVYMAHPLSGRGGGDDIRANIGLALQWLKYLSNVGGFCVTAPWIAHALALDDRRPDQRALGIGASVSALVRCDGLILCGSHISPGMEGERDSAIQRGLTVVDATGERLPPRAQKGDLLSGAIQEVFAR